MEHANKNHLVKSYPDVIRCMFDSNTIIIIENNCYSEPKKCVKGLAWDSRIGRMLFNDMIVFLLSQLQL